MARRFPATPCTTAPVLSPSTILLSAGAAVWDQLPIALDTESISSWGKAHVLKSGFTVDLESRYKVQACNTKKLPRYTLNQSHVQEIIPKSITSTFHALPIPLPHNPKASPSASPHHHHHRLLHTPADTPSGTLPGKSHPVPESLDSSSPSSPRPSPSSPPP
jgi:hypothetical protein